MKCPIKYKIALIILVILVPLAGFSLYHYYAMVSHEKEEMKLHDLELAFTVARDLDGLLDKSAGILAALSEHPDVKSLNADACDRLFAKLLPAYPDYLNIILADMKGRNRGSGVSWPGIRTSASTDTEWFAAAAKGAHVAGDLHVSKLFKSPSVMVAAPVFDGERNQIGVIGMPVSLEKMSARLASDWQIREKSPLIVIDSKGNVLFAAGAGNVIGKNLGNKTIIRKVLGSASGSVEASCDDGLPGLYSFISLTRAGWRVVICHPVDEAKSAASRMSRPYIVALMILCVIALGLAFMLNARISKSLSALTSGLRAIEHGNLSVQMKLPGRDELADVARAFNRMAEKRKAAEQRAKDSDSFLTSVLDGIGEGVVVVDRNYTIISANNGYCRQIDSPCDDIIGKHCYAVSHLLEKPCTEDVNGCGCTVKRCFETGEHHRSIHTHYDRAGKMIHVETNAYPLKDPSGNIIAAVETLMDVTQRVAVEKQLEEAIDRYRGLYDGAPDMMHSLDKEGSIIVCNMTEANALGYDSEGLIGMPAMKIIAPESRHAFAQKLDVMRTTGSFEGELSYLAKDGRRIPVFVKARAVCDRNGIFLKYDEISRDITEKKSLEAQLLHAQKLEAIGTLAAGVAHDFNNILTAVTGYGSLLRARLKNDGSMEHFVEEILAASARATYLTRSLLAFGRKQTMNKTTVDLNAIIRRMAKLLERVIGEQIEIKTELSEKNLNIMADSVQIEQVLMNLSANARDAMPSGGQFIIRTDSVELDHAYIKTHGYGTEGTYAQMTISDTGIGMDEKTQDRIFDPFFTTKDVGKGTGLGLAISYGIMKQHNGYINCYSEAGKGTTFKVYLPLEQSVSEGTKPAEPAICIRGHETVLVAEDDKPTRTLLEALLEEYGYTVIAAKDGEDAVKLFTENKDRIDLVILDVIMPKKKGKDVFLEIRKMKPDVKTLFTSGYTADIIEKDDLLGRGVDFISKPVSPTELLKKARAMLAQ